MRHPANPHLPLRMAAAVPRLDMPVWASSPRPHLVISIIVARSPGSAGRVLFSARRYVIQISRIRQQCADASRRAKRNCIINHRRAPLCAETLPQVRQSYSTLATCLVDMCCTTRHSCSSTTSDHSQLQTRGESSLFVHCNYEKYKAMIIHKKGSESNQSMFYGIIIRRVQKVIRVCSTVMSFILKLLWSQIHQFRHLTCTSVHAEVCRYIWI